MKKIILVAAVGMGVFATSLCNAQTNNVAVAQTSERGTIDLSVKAYKDMKYRLFVGKLSEHSHIAIKRESGEVLYNEYIAKAGVYSKIFDLSNLADGNYTFVVESNEASAEKAFAIKTETTRTLTPISAK